MLMIFKVHFPIVGLSYLCWWHIF